MGARNYQHVIVWQTAMDLAEVINAATGWPRAQLYLATNQV